MINKELLCAGEYLNLFRYTAPGAHPYEVCSRKRPPNPNQCDGVEIVALNHDRTAICLIEEYRPAVESAIVSFPGGLINPGEGTINAASRELYEETGLIMTSIIQLFPRSFQAPGLTDESCVVIICEADGSLTNEHNVGNEYTHPFFVTKPEARFLLRQKTRLMPTGCQMLLSFWTQDMKL